MAKLIKILFHFIGCIFSIFIGLLLIFKENNLSKHLVLSNILSAFSKLFTLIPYLKPKVCPNKVVYDSDIKKINSDKFELIHTDTMIEIVSGKGRYPILSAIAYFIQDLLIYIQWKLSQILGFWIFYLLPYYIIDFLK